MFASGQTNYTQCKYQNRCSLYIFLPFMCARVTASRTLIDASIDVKMLSVSVILLILLSTTCVSNAENCDAVKGLLKNGLGHVRIMKTDFPSKPILGENVKYCSGFDYTCCSKGLEEKLAAEARRNFKQDFDYVITEQKAYCTNMKTHLSSVIQDAFKKTFSEEVYYQIGSTNITGNIHQLLSPLYNYLTQFAYSSDICSLFSVLESQLLKLAKQVFHDQVDGSPCFDATINQYNTKFVKSIMKQLEPLLGKLRYLLKGYMYRNKIIEFMSSYHAPPHCVKSLMVMTFCSTCTYGITPQIMTPCHNLCVNTMQGCLVDLADLNLSVKHMVSLLDRMKFTLHLTSNIKHVGIKLRRYILGLKNDSAMIKQKLIANNCLLANYKRDLMSNNLLLTPNVDDILPPLVTHSTDLHLASAISNELKCIKHITLLNIPNNMCIERYDTKGNNNCWSASSVTGYTAPVAGFTRHALQSNMNPVFQDVKIPSMNILSINITHFTKEMREIDYQLHCSDDEDCMKFPHYTYICPGTYSTEESSGSGTSNEDNDTTELTSSGSIPITRINIAVDTSLNTNISLPPTITYTNSIPTSASPKTESDASTVANNSGNTTSETFDDNMNNFSPIMNKYHSGNSIVHSELWHHLLAVLLGMLCIF